MLLAGKIGEREFRSDPAREFPTVRRGPHEYADPQATQLLGRDWVSQSEVLPGEVASPRPAASPSSSPLGAEPLGALMARRED